MFLWFINVLKAVNKHRENTISLGSGFVTVIHVLEINPKLFSTTSNFWFVYIKKQIWYVFLSGLSCILPGKLPLWLTEMKQAAIFWFGNISL